MSTYGASSGKRETYSRDINSIKPGAHDFEAAPNHIFLHLVLYDRDMGQWEALLPSRIDVYLVRFQKMFDEHVVMLKTS